MVFSAVIDILDKARSKIYGVFALWVGIGFSPVIFTALFIDQRLIYESKGLLKNEYVRVQYFDFTSWQGWAYVVAVPILATLMTWLVVWKFPTWFVNRSYQQEVKNQYAKEAMLLDEQKKLEAKRNKIVETKLDTAEKEESVVKQTKKVEADAVKNWEKDYSDFQRTVHFDSFDSLIDVIYQHGGQVKYWDSFNERDVQYVTTSLLSYADGTGIVNYDPGSAVIQLTDKGKFFILKYQSEKVSPKA